ncbi:hypothetical protein Bbelb_284120 [Branchiostoma belcheri]|nr:hypothetical protein Bbelb_284120 [Branchiostoma belcheri]
MTVCWTVICPKTVRHRRRPLWTDPATSKSGRQNQQLFVVAEDKIHHLLATLNADFTRQPMHYEKGRLRADEEAYGAPVPASTAHRQSASRLAAADNPPNDHRADGLHGEGVAGEQRLPIRTNNDLEGYHTRLNKKAQNSLDFYLLVELLCKEAEYVNIQAKMPYEPPHPVPAPAVL